MSAAVLHVNANWETQTYTYIATQLSNIRVVLELDYLAVNYSDIRNHHSPYPQLPNNYPWSIITIT